MKLIPTLHPSFIQYGNWPSLELLKQDLEKANAQSWFPEVKREEVEYVVYPTPSLFRDYVRVGDPRPLYYDIETIYGTETIVCVGVGREPKKIAVFPWREPYIGLFKSALLDPATRKVTHNALFDMFIVERVLGITIPGEWFCTMQAHSLVYPDLRHGLDKIAMLYYDDLPWKRDQGSTLEIYCCKDVDVMARAEKQLSDNLDNMGLMKLFQRTTMRCLRPLDTARRHGVRVDLVAMDKLREEFLTQQGKAQALVWANVAATPVRKDIADELIAEALRLEKTAADNWVVGKKREMGKLKTKAKRLRKSALEAVQPNLNSPKQLKQLLYVDLKLPKQRRKNTKGLWQITTDDKALVELTRRTQHPVPAALRQWRDATTTMKYLTYEDEFLHPHLLPHGTGTGRFSCTGPNLQNLPKRKKKAMRIRSIFKPVIPGNMLTSVDFSQLEIRIQAHLSQDPTLVKAFADGVDIHTFTAATGLSIQRGREVTMEEVTADERYIFKRATYLEAYGGGYMKLQTELAADGIYVTPDEARRLLEVLRFARPGLTAWRDQQLQVVAQTSMLRNPFGRIRWFPGPAFGDALNFIPQSTAADIIILAMNDLYDLLPEGAIMVMQVHDELITEHPPELAKDVAEIVQRRMEEPIPEMGGWFCPTDMKQGVNWAFGKE